MTTHRTNEDTGAATAFLLTGALTLFLLLALAIDVGLALSEKNRVFHLAQEAARIGAQEIDLAAYRADGTVALEPAAATSAGQDHLTAAEADGDVSVTGDTVTVTAERSYTFVLLPLGTRTAGATASATPLTEPTP